jgi:addiction module HigA family antidote
VPAFGIAKLAKISLTRQKCWKYISLLETTHHHLEAAITLTMTPSHTYLPDTISHPGETLREKLEELGMSLKELALRTGQPEKTISFILNGESGITPDMAVRFEDVLKVPARFWVRRQGLYDEGEAGRG